MDFLAVASNTMSHRLLRVCCAVWALKGAEGRSGEQIPAKTALVDDGGLIHHLVLSRVGAPV